MSRAGNYRHIKKDYQKKNLCNPFFGNHKKKAHHTHHGFFIALGLGLSLVVVWFFFAAPVFALRDIQVEGLTRMPADQIINRAWNQAQGRRMAMFSQSNLWLFDREALQSGLIDTYHFADAKVSRHLTHRLVIKISERPFSFIYQEGSGFFYASADGYAIRDVAVAEEDKARYPVIENQNATLIKDDNQIGLKPDYLSFVLSLGQNLNQTGELPVERYLVDQEFNTLKVKFVNGPVVYFNTKDDPGAQAERLRVVKKMKIQDNFSKTKYIDLRYGERVFMN